MGVLILQILASGILIGWAFLGLEIMEKIAFPLYVYAPMFVPILYFLLLGYALIINIIAFKSHWEGRFKVLTLALINVCVLFLNNYLLAYALVGPSMTYSLIV